MSYLINQETIDKVKARRKLKTKRINKSKKLIKTMVSDLIEEHGIDTKKIPLKVTFYNDHESGSHCRSWISREDGRVLKQRINIDMVSLKRFFRWGYDNDYYKGRAEVLNPIVKKNFKKTLRFIILHELGHVIDRRITKRAGDGSEKIADDFALKNL